MCALRTGEEERFLWGDTRCVHIFHVAESLLHSKKWLLVELRALSKSSMP
jgi:hypothetical protein